MQPTKFELVLNLDIAKTLSIPSRLARRLSGAKQNCYKPILAI
jgi:hypothetical protein